MEDNNNLYLRGDDTDNAAVAAGISNSTPQLSRKQKRGKNRIARKAAAEQVTDQKAQQATMMAQ